MASGRVPVAMVAFMAVLMARATLLAAGRVAAELADEERSLAQSNCYGLAAELLAEDAKALVSLLATEEGRRAARAAALRTLLGNATEARLAGLVQEAHRGRRINLCESAWFDWLPWLPCRVQSPPPRPDFQDEERGGDSEGPLCYITDRAGRYPRPPFHVFN